MFIIYHSNDFHNRLLPSHVGQIKQLRDEIGEAGLLIDSGDAVGSGNITFRRSGEEILSMMNEAGYDALTVGNREFHLTRVGFQSKLRRAEFPILGSNIFWKQDYEQTFQNRSSEVHADYPVPLIESWEEACGGQPCRTLSLRDRPVADYVVKQLISQSHHERTLCVVLFGLSVPMIVETMWEKRISAYLFSQPIQHAKVVVPILRRLYPSSLLVAVTHIGINWDRQLAQAVPDIDLIIGGHSHTTLEQGERIGETLIVHAGSHARYLGCVRCALPELKTWDQRTIRESLTASLISLST